MVFESRVEGLKRKTSTTLVLDKKQFPFIKDMNVGDVGQMELIAVVDSSSMYDDGDGNELISVYVSIDKFD